MIELIKEYGIEDLTSYDEYEVSVGLNNMNWLEITPAFPETDLEIIISNSKHRFIAHSSVDRIIINSNQIIGESNDRKRIIEFQEGLVKEMLLQDTYLEIIV